MQKDLCNFYAKFSINKKLKDFIKELSAKTRTKTSTGLSKTKSKTKNIYVWKTRTKTNTFLWFL